MSDPEREGSSRAMVGGEDAASSLYDQAYPEELRGQEREIIRERRAAAGIPESDRLAGVGLSGGGIRSATFCLGAFQALARKGGILRRFDFLSTVSGGGYFGAFFGRLLGRDYVQDQNDADAVLKGVKKPEVLRYLRENGRYLSPNGAGDLLLAGAVLLRNWVSIQVVLLIFLLGVFLALQVLRVGLEQFPGFSTALAGWTVGGLWWSPFVVLPLLTFVLGAFPIGWAYWLMEPESRAIEKGGRKVRPPGPDREPAHRWRRSFLPPWTGLALVLVASVWLTLATLGVPVAGFWGLMAIVAVATLVWWRIAERRPLPEEESFPPGEKPAAREIYRGQVLRNRLGLWVTWALVITGGLLGLAILDSVGQTLYVELKNRTLGIWLAGVFSSWAALASFARRIAVSFSKGPGDKRPPVPLQWMATVAALVIVALLLVSLDAVSHAIAWSFQKPPGAPASLVKEKKKEEGLTVDVRGGHALSLKVEAGTAGDADAKQGEVASDKQAGERPDVGPALLGLAFAFLLSIFFGQTWPFVNSSSHQQLYSARLTRAYLGASNPERLRGRGVTEVLPGDDAALAGYWPPPAKTGTPIHLINVTINETIDGRSQIQQQDRKGNGMALGPCGLSVNVQHHLLLPFGKEKETDPVGAPVDIYPRDGFRVFEYPVLADGGGRPVFTGEMLPLGSWVGISGAAFSTGTGAQTSLGLSLLAGLGNVRLGRWWDSGVTRRPEAGKRRRKVGLRVEDFLARLFPVQVYLLDEFLARFPGTARRHWYLSDGGHFENLGGYELVRRRLRTIVLLDAEQDGEYVFGGLSNLVRKARLDFGAEIEFLKGDELDREVDASVRRHFGTLEQLRRGTWKDGTLVAADPAGLSQAHAALARITYSSPDTTLPSRLLYIKPTLTGDEPVDVLEYHQAHPGFPHESTADQFFDEAQWESYRRLGEHIAEKLFAPPPQEPGKWRPGLLADEPQAASGSQPA